MKDSLIINRADAGLAVAGLAHLVIVQDLQLTGRAKQAVDEIGKMTSDYKDCVDEIQDLICRLGLFIHETNP